MNIDEARYQIGRLLHRYRLLRFSETVIAAAAVGLLVYTGANLITNFPALAAGAAVAFALAGGALRIWQLRLLQIDERSLITFINRHYPEMEESSDLLLSDGAGLTALEQIQQARITQKFSTIHGSLRLPHKLQQAAVFCIVCVMLAGAVVLFLPQPHLRMTHGDSMKDTIQVSQNAALPAAVNHLDVRITPPDYTQVREKLYHAFPLTAPEGSRVSWSVGFTDVIGHARIIFNGTDTLPLSPASTRYTAETTLFRSGFYQLTWSANGAQKYSDFYPVQLVKDAPPAVTINNLPQFTKLEASSPMKVDMKSTITDDYGLTDAYIIATVSKGSGEGIKFREERLRFDSPSKISGRSITPTKEIDLIKLGLDPGDELYFYVEAIDNKTPGANKTRTETYFIALEDTAVVSASIDPGLGVDLMPAYFRSQRQIIIDSEKLLKDRPRISREEFNSRSNELAHDQKVLRLRYGEFLGEEFETSIGPAHAEVSIGPETDVTKVFGHQHDTDEEHAARHETPSDAGTKNKDTHTRQPDTDHDHSDHDHTNHSGSDSKNTNPVKAYIHDHDSNDEATFFTQSIRAKLKAAITIMWDAELHLRLYSPDKSLPYQYRALKLLKEISQDSRIYVHRTGFDPPPLKEDKRLTADLTEIKNNSSHSSPVVIEKYPAIRKALALFGNSGSTPRYINPNARDLLLRAGNELSMAALEQPGRYLKALSQIRPYAENQLTDAERQEAAATIRAAFYSVIPQNAQRPSGQRRTTHPLDEAFLEQYQPLSNPLIK